MNRHDYDRMIREWFHGHRGDVVYFSYGNLGFVRIQDGLPRVVIV